MAKDNSPIWNRLWILNNIPLLKNCRQCLAHFTFLWFMFLYCRKSQNILIKINSKLEWNIFHMDWIEIKYEINSKNLVFVKYLYLWKNMNHKNVKCARHCLQFFKRGILFKIHNRFQIGELSFAIECADNV
jgi:hypothetical protein